MKSDDENPYVEYRDGQGWIDVVPETEETSSDPKECG